MKIDTLNLLLNDLVRYALNRSDKQGLVVYEAVLEKLQCCDHDEDFVEILKSLERALLGIEAHGYFSNEEYQVVEKIRNL